MTLSPSFSQSPLSHISPAVSHRVYFSLTSPAPPPNFDRRTEMATLSLWYSSLLRTSKDFDLSESFRSRQLQVSPPFLPHLKFTRVSLVNRLCCHVTLVVFFHNSSTFRNDANPECFHSAPGIHICADAMYPKPISGCVDKWFP